jgi:hypothetical protein
MSLAPAPARAVTAREDPWAGMRTRIALALVLLYAGASTVRWLQHGSHWPARAFQDDISANERRFAALRPLLPAHGLVGYLSDPELAGATPRDSNAAALHQFRRYLLAQYALAPALLVKGTEPELVVGNFDPGTTPTAPAGLRIVRDFGDGLVLLRRSAP